MFIGKNKSTGEIVDIEDALNQQASEYVCPICGSELIIKNGSIVSPHFAHKVGADCDTFSHDMSAWHKEWQALFPKRNREHIEELKIKASEYRKAAYAFNFARDSVYMTLSKHKDDDIITLRHRADIRACGYVIEIQKSPISREEFNERNWFYRAIGCKVIWVFNFNDAYENDRIQFWDDVNSYYGGGKYKWNHAAKMFKDFLPQNYKKRKDRFGNWIDSQISVFFQICDDSDEGIEQVVWALEDEDYCNKSNFKWFITSYKITTQDEFVEAVLNRKI